MKMIIILVFLMITCGSIFAEPRIDYEFEPYFDRFTKEAELRGVHPNYNKLIIRSVKTLPSNNPEFVKEAHCFTTLNIIEVNREEWDKKSDYCREQLIYHELGHCVLQRDHNDNYMTFDGAVVPASVMGSTGSPCELNVIFSERLKKYYVDELFGKEKI